MGYISDSTEEHEQQPVRCPICGASNLTMQYCRHVRWTFDQGDPLDFAHFALETSPYVRARGASVRDIPAPWWDGHAEWIVDQVLLHFDALDGYVFGELGDLDIFSRHIWKEFQPDPARPVMVRY